MIPGEEADAAAPAAADATAGASENQEPQAEKVDLSNIEAINGIGPAMAKKLRTAGINTIRDVAMLHTDDVRAAKLDEDLALHGAMERGNWIEQALDMVKRAERDGEVSPKEQAIDPRTGEEHVERPPLTFPGDDVRPDYAKDEGANRSPYDPADIPPSKSTKANDQHPEEPDENVPTEAEQDLQEREIKAADPKKAGRKRARLDFDKKKAIVTPALKGAKWYQDGKYFSQDGIEIFVDDDDLERLTPRDSDGNAARETPLARRKVNAGGVDLEAWAKGRASYNLTKVLREIRAQFGRAVSNEAAAVDFLNAELKIPVSQQRK